MSLRRGQPILTALAVALAAALGAATAALSSSTLVALLAVLATLAVVGAVVAVPALRTGEDAFSPLTLAAIFYLLSYTIGTIFYFVQATTQVPFVSPVTGRPDRLATLFGPDEVVKAAGLASLGFIALTLGYRLRLFRPLLRVIPPFPKAPDSVVGVALPLLAIGWAARLVDAITGRYFHIIAGGEIVSTGTSWLVYAAAQVPLVATCYVGACGWLRNPSSPGSARLRKLFMVLIALELAWTIPAGGRGQVLAILVAATVVGYYGRGRRLPWRTAAAVVAVLVLVIMPLGLLYRGDNRTYQATPTEALRIAVDSYVSRDPPELLETAGVATASRFSDVGSLAVMMENGRLANIREPGETLSWIPTAGIPRAIAPDKPDPGLYGNEFGRIFGIIEPGDFITSISVTHVGELFLNFGVLGVVLGMPLAGAAYRLIGDYLRERTSDPLALATYAVFTWQLVESHETILAQGLTGTLRLLIVYTVLLWALVALARRRRT